MSIPPFLHSLVEYRRRVGPYRLLPFRFTRIPQLLGRILVTSEVGEYEFLSGAEFRAFVAGTFEPTSTLFHQTA